MSYYIIALRLLHIFSGVFWAGATIYLAAFIIPAVKAIPEGGKFMQQLSNTNRLPLFMLSAATLNVLTGVLLVWQMSAGFNAEWFASAFGCTLTIGGTLAIIAYIIGLTVNLPTVKKIAAIGKEVAAAGGPPSPEKLQQMMILRERLASATNVVAVLLSITVIGMAIGRYL